MAAILKKADRQWKTMKKGVSSQRGPFFEKKVPIAISAGGQVALVGQFPE